MEGFIVILSVFAIIILLILRTPVFIAIFAGSAVYFLLTPDIPSQILAQRIIVGTQSIPLLAIPFFICAGIFMNYSGVTKRVMNFAEVVIGHMPGGLAQVNILLSTVMGGLSGSNLADAAMQAKMIVPEMERKGFSKEFSTVVTAASAMITPLIPPGIAMIIYGSIANVSIGKLFVAGIGPGIFLCIAMMILVAFISKKRKYKVSRDTIVKPKEFLKALKGAVLPLFLPVIIVGGIRLGIFTPTEAGAFAVVYALLLGLIYRELTFKNLLSGVKETINGTAAVMLIVAAASTFAWILTREQIPQHITGEIIKVISNKYLFLLIVNIFLLIVGMFIEGNAAMIVLVPLLAPAAKLYGINEIQFAMIFIFNMAIGCLSPPIGTLMFVTCGITKCKIENFLKEAVPFYILLFFCLMLLTFIPAISTGIVDLVY